MGGKSSRPPPDARTKENGGDGQTTLRAISRGRVYVVITFPAAAQRLENCHFNEGGYDELLGDLQQVRLCPIRAGINPYSRVLVFLLGNCGRLHLREKSQVAGRVCRQNGLPQQLAQFTYGRVMGTFSRVCGYTPCQHQDSLQGFRKHVCIIWVCEERACPG